MNRRLTWCGFVFFMGTYAACVPPEPTVAPTPVPVPVPVPVPALTPLPVPPNSVVADPWIEGLEIHRRQPAAPEEPTRSYIVVEPGPPVGTLPRDAMEAVVRPQQAALQACARTTPELSGHVVVKFVINTEGVVTQAQVARTSIARPDVEDCLKRTIRAWKFPPPKGGIVITSYGVRFAPKNK